MNLYSAFIPTGVLATRPDCWETALQDLESRREFQFFPAQRAAAALMLSRDANLLAAEGGTGKTLMAATLITMRTTGSDTVVVVAPKGAHQQWSDEIRRFIGRRVTVVDHPGSLAVGINLICPSAFRGDRTFNRAVTMVVLDEAHFLATPSEQSLGFLSCASGVLIRLAMSATPVPNHIGNLFNLLGWLSAPSWNSSGSSAFPYAPFEYDRFERDYGMSGTTAVASPTRLQELLAPFVVNLTKAECRPGMPPLRLEFMPCALTTEAWTSWSKCFKLGSPSTIEMDFLTATDRSFGKTVVAGVKLQRLLQASEQVLVVSVRKEPLQQLFELLTAADIPVGRIYSDVPDSTYAETAENFKNGTLKVLLMGQRCAQSYSFPNCKEVILIGSDFTYGMFHQALWRCHRLNSEHTVRVSILYYPSTNEPLVLERVAAKANQAALVMGSRDYEIEQPPSGLPLQLVAQGELNHKWEGLKKSFHKVLDTARAISV